MSCQDCAHACVDRTRGYCGVHGGSRVAWAGTTYAEEHEIAPTHELFLTGCSLRCRFCYQEELVLHPQEGVRLDPEQWMKRLQDPATPPFRSLSFVGGEPSVNLPFIRTMLPRIRAQMPQVLCVFNTNLFLHPSTLGWIARSFDWIVGDLHFWEPRCAQDIAGEARYPEVARAALEGLVAARARLIVRLLVLPGHLDCCAAPSARWLLGLGGDALLRVHTGYAPRGRARGDPLLGRHLRGEEIERARALLPADRRPAPRPLPGAPARPLRCRDAPSHVDIDPEGNIFIPYITGETLPLSASLDPGLQPALDYLTPPSAPCADPFVTSLDPAHHEEAEPAPSE